MFKHLEGTSLSASNQTGIRSKKNHCHYPAVRQPRTFSDPCLFILREWNFSIGQGLYQMFHTTWRNSTFYHVVSEKLLLPSGSLHACCCLSRAYFWKKKLLIFSLWGAGFFLLNPAPCDKAAGKSTCAKSSGLRGVLRRAPMYWRLACFRPSEESLACAKF